MKVPQLVWCILKNCWFGCMNVFGCSRKDSANFTPLFFILLSIILYIQNSLSSWNLQDISTGCHPPFWKKRRLISFTNVSLSFFILGEKYTNESNNFILNVIASCKSLTQKNRQDCISLDLFLRQSTIHRKRGMKTVLIVDKEHYFLSYHHSLSGRLIDVKS